MKHRRPARPYKDVFTIAAERRVEEFECRHGYINTVKRSNLIRDLAQGLRNSMDRRIEELQAER